MQSTGKRTATLRQSKFQDTKKDKDQANKRSVTASTSKAVGLSDEMIQQIQADPDLHCLLKLHETVQKVKGANNENSVKIGELKELFKNLNENIQNVFKEQSASMQTTKENKKEEPGKKK